MINSGEKLVQCCEKSMYNFSIEVYDIVDEIKDIRNEIGEK